MAAADYQTQLRFRVDIPAGTSFVDGAAILSAGNHRLYRQFKGYKMRVSINNVGTGTAGQDSAFVVGKLPTTWPLVQSLKHGKAHYEAAMGPESKDRNRWADFRMRMRGLMTSTNTISVPQGVSVTNGVNYSYGFSSVSDGTGTPHTFVVTGPSILTGADRYFSVTAEYDQSDNTNPDFQTGSSNYHLIDEDINQTNEQIVDSEGALPPYNTQDIQLPRDEYDLYTMAAAAPGAQQRSTGWIDVPLGLLEITNGVADTRELVIEFAKGDYKGVSVEDF